MMNAPLSVSRGASVAGAFCACRCVAGGCPGCGCCAGCCAGGWSAGTITRDGACAETTALAASRRSGLQPGTDQPGTDQPKIEHAAHELFLFGRCGCGRCRCGARFFQRRLLGFIQFRLLLFPLPDSEGSLAFESHLVALFGRLDPRRLVRFQQPWPAHRSSLPAGRRRTESCDRSTSYPADRCSACRHRRPSSRPPESPAAWSRLSPSAPLAGLFCLRLRRHHRRRRNQNREESVS